VSTESQLLEKIEDGGEWYLRQDGDGPMSACGKMGWGVLMWRVRRMHKISSKRTVLNIHTTVQGTKEK
jgi:hypothetical protein